MMYHLSYLDIKYGIQRGFSSTPAGIGLKVHADSVKNESARTKKTKEGLKGVYRRIFFRIHLLR